MCKTNLKLDISTKLCIHLLPLQTIAARQQRTPSPPPNFTKMTASSTQVISSLTSFNQLVC